MGHSLGTAHAELRPQTREDIEKRALQLKHLVGSQYIDAQLDAGRKLQNQYAIRNKNDATARAVMALYPGRRVGGSAGGPVRPALRVTASDPGRPALDTGYLPT